MLLLCCCCCSALAGPAPHLNPAQAPTLARPLQSYGFDCDGDFSWVELDPDHASQWGELEWAEDAGWCPGGARQRQRQRQPPPASLPGLQLGWEEHMRQA